LVTWQNLLERFLYPWLWKQAFSSLKQDEQNASSKEYAQWKQGASRLTCNASCTLLFFSHSPIPLIFSLEQQLSWAMQKKVINCGAEAQMELVSAIAKIQSYKTRRELHMKEVEISEIGFSSMSCNSIQRERGKYKD
jgi:hypothetical protein